MASEFGAFLVLYLMIAIPFFSLALVPQLVFGAACSWSRRFHTDETGMPTH